MKLLNKTILIVCLLSPAFAEEPMQVQVDLQKARENILAGTVGKSSSPVAGAAQKTVGEDNGDSDGSISDGSDASAPKKSSKNKKKAAPPKPVYSYHDEKILNWIYETNDMIAKENSAQASVKPVSFRGALAEAKKTADKTAALASLNKNMPKPTFNITGTCTIPEDVNLPGNSKGVLTAFCDTNKGKFKLFGELTPKPEEYSLEARPVYMEDVYGKRYYADNNRSYVLNSKKNSKNIATFVNTSALDKVMRESISSSAKHVSSTATQYMQDLKQSRTTQQSTAIPNTGVVIATNTQKPVASDYLSILGIQMSAEFIDKWAAYAYQDHPWGFMIIGQSKIYIDLTVEGEIKQ